MHSLVLSYQLHVDPCSPQTCLQRWTVEVQLNICSVFMWLCANPFPLNRKCNNPASPIFIAEQHDRAYGHFSSSTQAAFSHTNCGSITISRHKWWWGHDDGFFSARLFRNPNTTRVSSEYAPKYSQANWDVPGARSQASWDRLWIVKKATQLIHYQRPTCNSCQPSVSVLVLSHQPCLLLHP